MDDEKEFSPEILDSFFNEFGSFIFDIGSGDGIDQDGINSDEKMSNKLGKERKMEVNVNMTKFYGYAGHQIHKMLLKCSWRRKPCSAANFTATFTDAGKLNLLLMYFSIKIKFTSPRPDLLKSGHWCPFKTTDLVFRIFRDDDILEVAVKVWCKHLQASLVHMICRRYFSIKIRLNILSHKWAHSSNLIG